MTARRASWIVWLVVAAALVPGCAPRRPPVLEAVRNAPIRNPLVIVPGISGSRLVDTSDGKIVWGRTGNFFGPRDGGARLALPVDPDLREADPLEPAGAVLGFRLLGLVKIDIYRSLIEMLEANGYRLGDLDDPRPGETLFVFDYDWRRGNVEAAAQLARALERLREARGGERLSVDLICQSNAARLARYYLKYGGAPLDDAEAGRAGPPAGIRAERLILVGTAHGGALNALRDLHRGRKYVPWVGRRFRAETIFTFPSLYEALPVYRDPLFFDEDGADLDADLFDAADWRRYGWSIYAPEAARRLKRLERRVPAYGDAQSREAFLAAALERARRLDTVLRRDVPGFGPTRYYELQNLYIPTSDRALLTERDGTWRTVFNDQRRVRKDRWLFQRASRPGDGHATDSSHDWLSPQERAARAGRSVSIPIAHRKIVLHPSTWRLILEALAEPRR